MRNFTTEVIAARYGAAATERMQASGYVLPPAVGDAPDELRRNAPAPTMPKARCRVIDPRFLISGRPVEAGEVLTLDDDLVRDLVARNLAERV